MMTRAMPRRNNDDGRRSATWLAASLALLLVALLASPSLVAADDVDLSNFSLQLPIKDKDGSGVLTKNQNELKGFSNANFFRSSGMLVLVTRADGAQTSGSDYPRTELREMTDGWSTKDQKPHVLRFTGAVYKLTPKMPKVTIAQIKNVKEQPLELRVHDKGVAPCTDAPCVYVRYDSNKGGHDVLDPNYKLKSFYTITVTASKGKIEVTYVNKDTDAKKSPNKLLSASGCYFKVGNYLQSNTSYDSASASSEVRLKSLSVS